MLAPILCLVAASVYCYYIFVERCRYVQDIPSASPCYPLVGNALTFMEKSPVKLFNNVAKPFAQFDRWFKVWLGPRLMLCTSHPALSEAILTHPKCLEKPFFYGFLKLDHGIMTQNYHQWKRCRKALSPSFNAIKVSNALPSFISCASVMVSNLESVASETSRIVSLAPFLSECMLNIIFSTTLGANVVKQHQAKNILKNLDSLLQMISSRALNALHYYDWIYRISTNYAIESQSRAECYRLVDKVIASRKHAIETTSYEVAESPAMLDRLLAAKEDAPLTDTEIIHNIYSIVGAGNDTTAHSLGHTCLFLAMHPEVQATVYQELCDVFGELDEPITEDRLKRLGYMECVLKESLRLAPPGATVARQTQDDVTIEGQFIPRGTTLVVSLFALHRRKDVWGENADTFDPERFRPERCQGRPACAYMPFNTGSRNCMGSRYAMLCMKVMLTMIVRSFWIRTDMTMEQLSFRFDIALKQEHGYVVRLEKREA